MDKLDPKCFQFAPIVAKINEIILYLARKAKKDKLDGDFDQNFTDFWEKWVGRWSEDKGEYVKAGKRLAWVEWKKLSLDDKRKAYVAADKAAGKYCQDACRWLRDGKFDDYDISYVVDKCPAHGGKE